MCNEIVVSTEGEWDTLIFSDSQFEICLCITVFVTNVSSENQLDITQVGGKVTNAIPAQGINRSAFYVVAEILLY